MARSAVTCPINGADSASKGSGATMPLGCMGSAALSSGVSSTTLLAAWRSKAIEAGAVDTPGAASLGSAKGRPTGKAGSRNRAAKSSSCSGWPRDGSTINTSSATARAPACLSCSKTVAWCARWGLAPPSACRLRSSMATKAMGISVPGLSVPRAWVCKSRVARSMRSSTGTSKRSFQPARASRAASSATSQSARFKSNPRQLVQRFLHALRTPRCRHAALAVLAIGAQRAGQCHQRQHARQ